MSTTNVAADRRPTPDPAEDNAFFPSPYSLQQYTSSKTDFDGVTSRKPYESGKWKVLMIATDERYLLMKNGAMFSTGNHPVEMLLPMHHIDQAGFAIDVATLSGNPVKLELWAMPKDDEAVQSVYQKYLPQLKQPAKLSDIIRDNFQGDSPYLAVFIPGGHGALSGIPHSDEVRLVLQSMLDNDRHIVTLCHGPACLLSLALGNHAKKFPLKGYKACVFPDELDRKNPEIGYMPGPMPWFVAEQLKSLGVEILNEDITGKCHVDRQLITGDSPLASNSLGKLAAEALLTVVAND
ncbi:Molecular chaperone Hsp31 and glyoxalase 3 [Caulifigura coniformis]|uniref:Molecular chaperone Hsp31 and glyoxalase 3 n=1 Tax=Caulifigura coniformis TaxID=2527983 RepID=A0A517S7F7_9PLAN|nr:glyoxalase III HchA [Caulifigura coniformis]QDT52071.1 Molecular chaperone Hsp31 and glyoxalase 3 [Caulifigura coniformis]